jgi:hypothetical protein
MVGAYGTLAVTRYFLGDFEIARQDALRGVQIWRSGDRESPVEEISTPAVACLCFEALAGWHLGEGASRTAMAEAVSLAKGLNDMHGLAVALYFAALFSHAERDIPQV